MARLLAIAHHFQELLDPPRAVESQAELAKLSPVRVTQIMNLPAWPRMSRRRSSSCHPVTDGQQSVAERHLRQVLKTVVWSEQADTLRLVTIAMSEPFCECCDLLWSARQLCRIRVAPVDLFSEV
jgi:hypothetical protein